MLGLEESMQAMMESTFRKVVREELTFLRQSLRDEEPKPAPSPAAPAFPSCSIDVLHSTAEVMRRLGYRSVDSVVKLINEGKLPAFKIAGSRNWSVRESDLARFIAGGKDAEPVQRAPQIEDEANRLLQRLGRK